MTCRYKSEGELGGAGFISGQYGMYDSSGFVLDITNLTTVCLEEETAINQLMIGY